MKDSAQSKYDQKLKKKQVSKQLSYKIIPAAVDVAGSKIADKITSLELKDEEPEDEIIIPSEKRQQIINDLSLFQLI